MKRSSTLNLQVIGSNFTHQRNYNELGFKDLQDVYGGSILDVIALKEPLNVLIEKNEFKELSFIGNDTSLIYLISDGDFIVKDNTF